MPLMGKTGVIEGNPHAKTIKFGGRYINLTAIARAQGFHPASLSNIFLGRKGLSLASLRKISAVLGMSTDEFMEALEERVAELNKKNATIVREFESRIAREDQEDLEIFRSGGVAAPRLPALRSA